MCETDIHLNPRVTGPQGRSVSPAPGEEIEDGAVLTWNERENRWEPRRHVEGNVSRSFVQAPAGEYAIVAAGYFDHNGDSVLGRPTYNGLAAERLGEGRYFLRFPHYPELRQQVEEITLIVKGTVVDPGLAGVLDDADNAEIRADMPATFQVLGMDREGILVWITQPSFRFDRFLAMADGDLDFPDGFNVLHFTPTDRMFMVEISAYGALALESAPPVVRVNINTATEAELSSLPRIGPLLARRIIALRESAGGFTSVTDLRRVPGIGDSLLSRLAHLITV